MSPEELVKEFSHLTLPQVYDALSYYYDNKEEIDRDLALKERNLKVKEASGNARGGFYSSMKM